MKSLDHNITDALVVSDEWENFDYNLRLQIEELGSIDYDSQSETWKANTLAMGYLYCAEKLLSENNLMDDYTLNAIRELKGKISHYDDMKTMLLTLRLAILTTKAGIIPIMAQYGYTTKMERSQAGLNSWGNTPEEREKRNDYIQNEIDRLCKSGISFRSACQIIAKKVNLNSETIRKRIAKNPHYKK